MRRAVAVLLLIAALPLSALAAGPAGPVDAIAMIDFRRGPQVKVGAWGDLIAVQGDPLADVTVLEHVTFVMKGGDVVRR